MTFAVKLLGRNERTIEERTGYISVRWHANGVIAGHVGNRVDIIAVFKNGVWTCPHSHRSFHSIVVVQEPNVAPRRGGGGFRVSPLRPLDRRR